MVRMLLVWACVCGHVLWMNSQLFKFEVKKARDVFELNHGVERRRRNVDSEHVCFINDVVSETVCPPFPSHEAEASVRGKRPRGSRERAPVHVIYETKDKDGVAHQQLLSNFRKYPKRAGLTFPLPPAGGGHSWAITDARTWARSSLNSWRCSHARSFSPPSSVDSCPRFKRSAWCSQDLRKAVHMSCDSECLISGQLTGYLTQDEDSAVAVAGDSTGMVRGNTLGGIPPRIPCSATRRTMVCRAFQATRPRVVWSSAAAP